MLKILPCLDSEKMADSRKKELNIPRSVAAKLGHSAVLAARSGEYIYGSNQKVDWNEQVQKACSATISISPETPLPSRRDNNQLETRIQVTNETTLGAAKRLVDRGLKPLALNFANGVIPGGGFLNGARAQEEVLCRSSALYQTISGDLMYEEHSKRRRPDSTHWAIYSPDVPVFRTDDGTTLAQPWLLSFLTCAAPYAPIIGQPESGDLLQQRVFRVLDIARSYGYQTLILGAWGCGAFANDPKRTAGDFRQAVETEFQGAFSEIVFAITDWSPERRYLGPFRDIFSSE